MRSFLVKPVVRETGILVAVLGGLAALSYLSGLDAALARALYQPDAPWAWFMRQYGAAGVGILAWIGFLALLWPKLEMRAPALYQSAAVMVVAAALGAGLLNQVLVKDMVERPRPRDTVLLDVQPVNMAELKGKAMPSGHAGMALVLAVPFFVLRRRHKALAHTVLAIGGTWGAAVGVARMVSGAHFLSDVLVAALITFTVALWAAAWLERGRPLPRLPLVVLLVLGLGAMVYFNKFTVNLRYEALEPWKALDLPCVLTARPEVGVGHPTISLTLQGYGAPLSQLELVNDGGTVRVRTEWGFYRGLGCEGKIRLPIQNTFD